MVWKLLKAGFTGPKADQKSSISDPEEPPKFAGLRI
jgi:hypothetical protein